MALPVLGLTPFQSTPSVWRETAAVNNDFSAQLISIHSLRMEGDMRCAGVSAGLYNFNPLPPYGGRLNCLVLPPGHKHFNPLPPYGGRHSDGHISVNKTPFQSTPSVWRETPYDPSEAEIGDISIHSLRMEGDFLHILISPAARRFQSTPSVWRETESIRKCLCDRVYFNPLPPYGGRPMSKTADAIGIPFQSTPSVWRET